MKAKDYIGGILVLMFVLFLGNYFFSFGDIQLSPAGISVTRILPQDYIKGQSFAIGLEIYVPSGFSSSDRLLLSELVENAEIVSSSGASYFSQDIVVWGNTSVQTMNLSYSVISNANSLIFQGKWGLGERQEGRVEGDSTINARVSSISDNGGNQGGGYSSGDNSDSALGSNNIGSDNPDGISDESSEGDSRLFFWIYVSTVSIIVVLILIFIVVIVKRYFRNSF